MVLNVWLLCVVMFVFCLVVSLCLSVWLVFGVSYGVVFGWFGNCIYMMNVSRIVGMFLMMNSYC